MYRKSNSSLSTTISSTNYSISSNGEQEQNEISAIISSYTLKQDDNKFFNKNYALYEIKLYTRYKTWSIYKRYSEFIELRDQLLLKKINNIPKLPPKLYFINDQKLNERQLGLEEFLNELFKNVNILRHPEIIDFIKCPKEILDILIYNIDYLNPNNSNTFSKINNNDNNFYCSLAKMNLADKNDKKNENNKKEFDRYSEEGEEISQGTIIIQEFLRNLGDTPFNKTELLFQFEYFLLNEDNNEDINDSNNNNKKNKNKNKYKWYFLTEEEIELFFNGFYSNISHTKINGFLYHCGNINNNKIASVQCLQFLKKLLSDDYNPQADSFLKIYKKCNINNIIQMELENHIIKNTNTIRINAFIVLYKYLEDDEDENDIENEIKKILKNETAEKLFLQWLNHEF